MDPRDSDKLRRKRVRIVENVDARLLIDFLFQEGILVTDDCEIIQSKVTAADRSRTLLDILPTRGPRAFGIFIAALRQSHYGWLADEIQ